MNEVERRSAGIYSMARETFSHQRDPFCVLHRPFVYSAWLQLERIAVGGRQIVTAVFTIFSPFSALLCRLLPAPLVTPGAGNGVHPPRSMAAAFTNAPTRVLLEVLFVFLLVCAFVCFARLRVGCVCTSAEGVLAECRLLRSARLRK